MEVMTAEEFHKSHSGQDGFVVCDGERLYSDGSRWCLENGGPLGPRFALPPADPANLRRLQLTFWGVRLENLVTEFTYLKGSTRAGIDDSARFGPGVQRLKELQTQIRSARSKLSHLMVVERGYTAADVERAWEVWKSFSHALSEESAARAKYQSALLGKSSAGILEKLKARFDQAKRASERAMEKWNSFEPPQARSIVNEELDERGRAERQSELERIEI